MTKNQAEKLTHNWYIDIRTNICNNRVALILKKIKINLSKINLICHQWQICPWEDKQNQNCKLNELNKFKMIKKYWITINQIVFFVNVNDK